jgi:predicted secreted Zn-dependent protease
VERQLARAIELAKAGQKAQARNVLIYILNQDSRNITAWKWFASVAQSETEARQALANILRLNPNDVWARRALGTLDARRAGRRTPQARSARARPRRLRGVAPALGVGLAIVVVGLCAVGIALAVAGTGFVPPVLQGAPEPALLAQATPVPVIVGDSALGPPTLPPTWTPSAMPSGLPTVTPLPTSTPLPTPGPTVTKVPTPVFLNVPPQGEVVHVPVAAPPSGSGPVIESQSIVYYPVTGSNASEINQSIENNGPKGGGQDAIAQVQYTISLQYTVQQSASACTPSEAVAYLSMEFTYPQYQPPSGVSQTILDQWDNFSQRIVTHEETHAQIARECAGQMVDSFQSLSPANSCSALENNLDVLLNAQDADCEARQIAYDQSEGGDSFP